jgi:hypothetical protein
MATALRIDQHETQAPKPLPEVFRLEGRSFRHAVSTSAVQDVFVTRRLRQAGIAAALPTDRLTSEADILRFAASFEDAIWAAFEAGIMYEILGGLLVEEGVVWTPAIALETAALIRSLTDPDEKDAIFEYAAEVLVSFFTRAAISRRTSLRSSIEAVTASTAAAADLASREAQTSSGSAVTLPTTMASGTPSSGSAPDGM